MDAVVFIVFFAAGLITGLHRHLLRFAARRETVTVRVRRIDILP